MSATKAKSQAVAVWSKRESWEEQLVRQLLRALDQVDRTRLTYDGFILSMQATPGADTPSLYQAYIAWELKPKKPDTHLVLNLYARAIAEQASKGPYEAEPFWVSLLTFLVSSWRACRLSGAVTDARATG